MAGGFGFVVDPSFDVLLDEECSGVEAYALIAAEVGISAAFVRFVLEDGGMHDRDRSQALDRWVASKIAWLLLVVLSRQTTVKVVGVGLGMGAEGEIRSRFRCMQA